MHPIKTQTKNENLFTWSKNNIFLGDKNKIKPEMVDIKGNILLVGVIPPICRLNHSYQMTDIDWL